MNCPVGGNGFVLCFFLGFFCCPYFFFLGFVLTSRAVVTAWETSRGVVMQKLREKSEFQNTMNRGEKGLWEEGGTKLSETL